jgi:Tol biopolymer transport system component
MTLRALLSAVLGCLALTLLGAPAAGADVFEPIELVSLRTVQGPSGQLAEQAEAASESVISADGRYVAFTGSFAGVRGIWRRDLQTGAVEEVAPGRSKLPSISAEGNYVSFTTLEALAPEDDHNPSPDVYVRDMEKPCGVGGGCVPCPEHQDTAEREACPFALVSAVNGSSEGASYSYPNADTQHALEEEESDFGSLASGRTAISASGELVVFETAAVSNLLGSDTPPSEILVRNLTTKETRLVSSEYEPLSDSDTDVPVPAANDAGAAVGVLPFGLARFGGASISADGSTVAWDGEEVAEQARLLPGEQSAYSAGYNEPLWRRIDEGPTAPTHRVTGGSDPENPACETSGEQRLPPTPSLADPCQGPFTSAYSEIEDFLLSTSGLDFVPQLSEKGEKVAFLASAREVAAGEEFPDTEADDDLYVSEIGGTSTRVRALRRITELAAEITDVERAAPISEFAISPDGEQIAFTTRRTEYPLSSLTYVSTTAAQAGVKELFDADLADGTLTRVTHGYGGEATPSEQTGGLAEEEGATSPSFNEDGDTLSFSSGADNLVYGDGNDASDAFVVTREVFPNVTPQQYLSNAPQLVSLTPAWKLSVTDEVERDGSVALSVLAPAAGVLTASATGEIPNATSARAGAARVKARRASSRRAHGRSGTSHAEIAEQLSTASRVFVAPGSQRIVLVPASRYRSLTDSADGLYATVTVHFAAPGHPPLTETLRVTFKGIPSKARHTSHSVKARRRGRPVRRGTP